MIPHTQGTQLTEEYYKMIERGRGRFARLVTETLFRAELEDNVLAATWYVQKTNSYRPGDY